MVEKTVDDVLDDMIEELVTKVYIVNDFVV